MTLRKYVCALLVLIPVMALQAQQKHALVIGNEAYTTVSRLNNPVNDANDMAAALRSLGFQVDLVLNGSLEQMEDGAIRLKNRLSTNANAYGFFFYAGHGVTVRRGQLPDSGKRRHKSRVLPALQSAANAGGTGRA
jgi:uncharacterized caspase-like protein